MPRRPLPVRSDGGNSGARDASIALPSSGPCSAEAPSNLAVIGRYVFTPEIFEAIEQVKPGVGGEIQLTDAIDLLLARQSVYGYRFTSGRYDTGNKLDWLVATVELAARRDDLGRRETEKEPVSARVVPRVLDVGAEATDGAFTVVAALGAHDGRELAVDPFGGRRQQGVLALKVVVDRRRRDP